MPHKDEHDSFIDSLGDFQKAIQEEYEVAKASDDIATVRSLIEKKLATAIPGFVDDLILIARMGDTDNARLKAISFAFNWYFREFSGADDPFEKLLGELTNNATATTDEAKKQAQDQ